MYSFIIPNLFLPRLFSLCTINPDQFPFPHAVVANASPINTFSGNCLECSSLLGTLWFGWNKRNPLHQYLRKLWQIRTHNGSSLGIRSIFPKNCHCAWWAVGQACRWVLLGGRAGSGARGRGSSPVLPLKGKKNGKELRLTWSKFWLSFMSHVTFSKSLKLKFFFLKNYYNYRNTNPHRNLVSFKYGRCESTWRTVSRYTINICCFWVLLEWKDSHSGNN